MLNFTPLGDRAVTVTLGDSIDEATHLRVRAAVDRIGVARLAGVLELVPAFASVTVHYEPWAVVACDADTLPYHRIVSELQRVLADLPVTPNVAPRTVEIPVCYGGDLGPDLEDVARRHNLSPDDVVRAHSGGDYLVYMIGFMPGFAYLGGLPPDIATARRQSPRTEVPEGAVGIGGQQTGVYSMVSPGGWNLIGRTPVKMFDTAREPAALLDTGDRVRFRPISRNEFDRWTA